MADLINAGVDLHRHVAAQLTEKRPDEVTDEERRQAKAVNFARPAGMGVPRLIKHAKSAYGAVFTEERAADFFACYDEEFTEITNYRNMSLDAGDELAWLLGMTPNEYNEAIGQTATDSPDGGKTAGWLGGMCLKALAELEPRTAKGMDERTRKRSWIISGESCRRTLTSSTQKLTPTSALDARLLNFASRSGTG
jgi:hypothetical protein